MTRASSISIMGVPGKVQHTLAVQRAGATVAGRRRRPATRAPRSAATPAATDDRHDVDVARARQQRGLPLLPLRDPDSHKGTFGTVAVWAGSAGMPGAAVLAVS